LSGSGRPGSASSGARAYPRRTTTPEDTARTVRSFLQATGAQAFDEGGLAGAAAAVREDVGQGPRLRIGTASSTTYLAEYFVLAALAPLGLVLWRRNFL
jgi:hypothetical protein